MPEFKSYIYNKFEWKIERMDKRKNNEVTLSECAWCFVRMRTKTAKTENEIFKKWKFMTVHMKIYINSILVTRISLYITSDGTRERKYTIYIYGPRRARLPHLRTHPDVIFCQARCVLILLFLISTHTFIWFRFESEQALVQQPKGIANIRDRVYSYPCINVYDYCQSLTKNVIYIIFECIPVNLRQYRRYTFTQLDFARMADASVHQRNLVPTDFLSFRMSNVGVRWHTELERRSIERAHFSLKKMSRRCWNTKFIAFAGN